MARNSGLGDLLPGLFTESHGGKIPVKKPYTTLTEEKLNLRQPWQQLSSCHVPKIYEEALLTYGVLCAPIREGTAFCFQAVSKDAGILELGYSTLSSLAM